MGLGARLHKFNCRSAAAFLLATTSVAAGLVLTGTQAHAQAQTRFDIPAGSLNGALAAFGRQSGTQIVYEASIANGKTSPGIRGAASREAALNRILQDTGLSYSFTDPTNVLITRSGATSGYTAPEGANVLERILLEGQSENAWGGVDGIVARRTATGSKTDTPILEVPQSISVVTADQLKMTGAQSVSEALRYTPGVDAEAYGFDARFNHFTVRGFQFDKFQFVDGMRFAAGSYAIPRIEPYGLERVEVLRGPSSGLYGQNVPGGMVNLVSKRPTEETIREVELGTGYPARIQGAFDFSGAANPDKTMLYRFVGAGNFGDTQVDHTTDQRLYLAPSLTFKPDEDTTFTVLAHMQKDNVEGWSGTFLPMQGTLLPNPNGQIPTSAFVGEPGYDHYRRDQFAIGYEFEHRFSEALKLRSSARYADVDVDAPNIYPDGFDADMRTLKRTAMLFRDHVRNFTADNNLTARFDLGPTQHTLIGGFDYQWLRDRDRFDMAFLPTPPLDIFNPVYGSGPLPPVESLSDNDITQNQFGLYVQDQIKLDNWVLTLGGRQDWAKARTIDKLRGPVTRTDDSAFTGRAGLAYVFDNGIAPYVSYSTSFEPAVGTTFEGDIFVPTTGQQYEAGIKYEPPGQNIFLSAALYQLTQQNVVTDDARPGVPPGNFIQEGEVRVRGFELEAKASVGDGWDLIGSYTFADAVTTKSNTFVDGIPVEGKYAKNIPRHQASAWAKYTFESGALAGLGIGAGLRYRSSLYGDNINRFEVPDVTLVDAALRYDFGKKNASFDGMVLNVNASNLLGKKYVANCDGAVCYYGGGRSVTATMTYRW